MSCDPVADIMSLLVQDGFGTLDLNIVTESTFRSRTKGGAEPPPDCIRVAQISGTGEPDQLDGCDRVRLEISVFRGHGQQGRYDAISIAYAIYRKLDLLLDQTIDGTFYPGIRTVSEPRESLSSDGLSTAFTFTIELLRYYGGTSS